jgi:hypothetical protein
VQCMSKPHRLEISAVVAQYQKVCGMIQTWAISASLVFVERNRVSDRSQTRHFPTIGHALAVDWSVSSFAPSSH